MPKPRLRQQYDEGPAAAKRFNGLVDRVLSVPHSVVAEKQQGMRERAERAKRRRKAS